MKRRYSRRERLSRGNEKRKGNFIRYLELIDQLNAEIQGQTYFQIFNNKYAGVIFWPKHIGAPNTADFEELTRIPFVCSPQMACSSTICFPPPLHRTHAIPITEAPKASGLLFRRKNFLLQPQTSPNPLSDNLLELLSPLPPHLGCLNVRRTLIVWFSQHAHHANQDHLGRLDWAPPLACALIMIRIIPRRVQNADANFAIGIDVWVKYFAQEFHGRRRERVVWRKGENGGEETTSVGG